MPLDDVIIIPRYCTQRFNLSVSGTLPLGSNSLKEGMTLTYVGFRSAYGLCAVGLFLSPPLEGLL